jgi:hypothetical protein
VCDYLLEMVDIMKDCQMEPLLILRLDDKHVQMILDFENPICKECMNLPIDEQRNCLHLSDETLAKAKAMHILISTTSIEPVILPCVER